MTGNFFYYYPKSFLFLPLSWSNQNKYKELLKYVTNDILGKIEEQDTLNIFSLGDLSGMLNNNANQNEFEIVSYLVIK